MNMSGWCLRSTLYALRRRAQVTPKVHLNSKTYSANLDQSCHVQQTWILADVGTRCRWRTQLLNTPKYSCIEPHQDKRNHSDSKTGQWSFYSRQSDTFVRAGTMEGVEWLRGRLETLENTLVARSGIGTLYAESINAQVGNHPFV